MSDRRLVILTTLFPAILLIAVLAMMPDSTAAQEDPPSIIVNSQDDFSIDDLDENACLPAGLTCTLRAAVQLANTLDGYDLIVFTDTIKTFTLSIAGGGEDDTAKGDIDIVGQLEIVGNGAGNTVINGDDVDRIFDVLAGSDLTISGVTIRGGGSNPAGGGIKSDGTLTVIDSVFEANTSNTGGGIYSNGSLNIKNSTFVGNSASNGGGIYHNLGQATVSRSTFLNNNAASNGGAILAVGGTVTLTNNTLSENSAGKGGGALATGTGTGPEVWVVNSTFANNFAPSKGGAIRVWRGDVYLQSSIIANGDDVNCSVHGRANLFSEGYNLSTDRSCSYDPNFDLQVDAGLVLQALDFNGGDTQSHALPEGSPAIDKIPEWENGCGDIVTDDQRGVSRPQAGLCDVGAFEVEEANDSRANCQSIDDSDVVVSTANDINDQNWYCIDVNVPGSVIRPDL